MFAAILAAVIAGVLSLGGASLVLAGNDNGHGNGNGAANGNGHSQNQDAQAPAVAPAPAPAPAPTDSGGSTHGNGNGGNHGRGQQKHAAAAPQQSQPTSAPSQPKHENSSANHAPQSSAPVTTSAPTTTSGGGSHSTATSGPGNSGQGCDGSHNSNTGHGANHSGPYDNTCDGSPSMNGNGGGQATGKPCAGCVGNADDKNPKGQYPNGSDHNAGYECDRNHGIGRSNPAHTGCTSTTPPPTCTGDSCGGDHPGCTTNCCTDSSCTPCPGGDQLGTALTHSAALALKVLSVLHPEFTKLSDAAVTKADEDCGHHPPGGGCTENCGGGHTPVTYCHVLGNGGYIIITSDDDSLPAHLAHGDIYPVPAAGCPGGSTSNSPTSYCKPNGSGGYTVEMLGAGQNLPAGGISPVPAGGCPAHNSTTPPAGGVLGTSGSGSTPTTPTPSETEVLGQQNNGTTAPGTTEVLGTRAAGTSPAPATPPAAVNQAQPAAKAGGTLPFTGTDAMLVLFLGCLLVLAGFAVHTVATRRSTN